MKTIKLNNVSLEEKNHVDLGIELYKCINRLRIDGRLKTKVSLSIENKVWIRFINYCSKEGLNRSAMVQELVEKYLQSLVMEGKLVEKS